MWRLTPTLYATRTAVICSHALPAMGRMMRPKKASDSPVISLTSVMASVSHLQSKSGRYKCSLSASCKASQAITSSVC